MLILAIDPGPEQSGSDTTRVVRALNDAQLTRRDFRLSEKARREIRQRDEMERRARKARLHIGGRKCCVCGSYFGLWRTR